MRWTWYYIRQSGTFKTSYDADVSRAWILRQAHTVEKGLSLPAPRAFFGQGKIEHLQEHLGKSVGDATVEPARKIGHGVLASYVKWHEKRGEQSAMLDALAEQVAANDGDTRDGGAIPYALNYTDEQRSAFDALMTSRRSLRNFTDEVLPQDVLAEAINVANHSPSVCNRQPWAAAVVQDPEMVKKMLKLQSGNKGFDQTIHNIVVVLADTRAFVEDYEVFEPYVDTGIFSGTLVNTLAARNIGSCCLNLCISHKKALRIIEVLNIEPQYFPIMMIAVDKIADNATVAQSNRVSPKIFNR